MNIQAKAEEKLAGLLGWTIREGGICGLPHGYKGDLWSMPLPHWTQDDAAAFKLVVEHNLIVAVHGYVTQVVYETYPQELELKEFFIDHNNDKFLATRYAIVLAVIAKLENK